MAKVTCTFDDDPAAAMKAHGVRCQARFTMTFGDSGRLSGILRRSSRAKHVRLTVDDRGIIVSVPANSGLLRLTRQDKKSAKTKFSSRASEPVGGEGAEGVLKELEDLLGRHLEWILNVIARHGYIYNHGVTGRHGPGENASSPAMRVAVPECLRIPALNELWRVAVRSDDVRRVRTTASSEGGVIELPRDMTPLESLSALRVWLMKRAKDVLPPMLLELAAEMPAENSKAGRGSPMSRSGTCLVSNASASLAEHVARVSVKIMRSRWGSCSSQGSISLNVMLLSLNPHLVRHVMLHELCHLIEMNHSRAFYDLLRDADPEMERNRAELREKRIVPMDEHGLGLGSLFPLLFKV